MMEMSLAIKSPSVHYHLAGTKKVQQELAKPGVLEKFLGDKAKIESVRDIFTGLYSLDKARNNSFKSLKLVIIKKYLFSGRNWKCLLPEGYWNPGEICPKTTEGGRWKQCIWSRYKTLPGEDRGLGWKECVYLDGHDWTSHHDQLHGSPRRGPSTRQVHQWTWNFWICDRVSLRLLNTFKGTINVM